jgi:hypothetical protein
MSISRLLLTLAGLAIVSVGSAWAFDRDPLNDVRDRMKIEAQRVEKEFADGRIAAYKLVRSDDPRLVEATEQLQTLLAMVRNDTSLDVKRREVLIVTVKADLERVRDIAAERRRFTTSRDSALLRGTTRTAISKTDDARRTESTRRVTDEARSIYEARSRSVADSRLDRSRAGDRLNRVMRSVEESAIPESRDYRLPKNWAELSKKRSAEQKMTAKEKAIMKALGTVIAVDFEKNTFEDVINYLRKVTGIEIIVDKRALEEVSVSYESPVSMKGKFTTRTILKRILGDLNLAYVIKEEAVQITSRERANQMTTTRTYYIGDLASVVDLRFPPDLTAALMIENVNRLITLIQQHVDPQSWKVNNADAVGAIYFDPLTISLVVKQTAEVHFLMGGYR